MPFFSVIIPTYNRANELRRSMESVLAQSYTDLELIIIDDGSTDNTEEVVSSFSDKRIRYIYQENRERSASRNNGMKAATGEYLCFLDSDDVYYDNHLETMHVSITANNYPVAIFKTSVKYVNDDGSGRGIPSISNGEDGVRYVWDNGCQLNSVCIHKNIGREILFPEPFFWFEDIYWAINVVLRYPLVLISQFTCTYTSNDTSGLLNGNYKKFEDNCVACMRYLETSKGSELKAILGKKCFDKKVSEHYLGFVVAGSVKTKKIRLGYSYLFKAMATCITPKLLLKYGYYFLKLLKASI